MQTALSCHRSSKLATEETHAHAAALPRLRLQPLRGEMWLNAVKYVEIYEYRKARWQRAAECKPPVQSNLR
jgi:hypothetical protein